MRRGKIRLSGDSIFHLLAAFGLFFLVACSGSGTDDDDGTTPPGEGPTDGTSPGPSGTPDGATPSPTPIPTPTPTPFPDPDGDGYGTNVDCDETNPAIHPEAPEICDGIDNDCDELIDDFDPDVSDDPGEEIPIWYMDRDDDGFGDDETALGRCNQPEGFVTEGGDCNDNDPSYYPGAPGEVCTNPNDYNCDGLVEYVDADEDGSPGCVDCDDQSPAINPNAEEVCDEIDNDCDNTIDDDDLDVQGRTAWYLDADGDGYGDSKKETVACFRPADNYVTVRGDCNDQNADVYPGATTVCNNLDNNCDGKIDFDADADGYSDPACGGADCDDSNPAAKPVQGGCALSVPVMLGDNDGFGFGIADGAALNSAPDFQELRFDNRTEDDPEFTDFGELLLNAGPLQWTYTFDVGYRDVTGAILEMDMAGIQDAAAGTCSFDDILKVDGKELPGAFDTVDQGSYGTGIISLDLSFVPDFLTLSADGELEIEFDLDREVLPPTQCGEFFSIDYAKLTVFADRTL